MSRLQSFTDQKSHVLPAAAANVSTPSLNLGPVTGGVLPAISQGTIGPVSLGDIEGELSADALPNLADATTVTLTLQHSLDDGSSDAYAAVPGVGALVITGAGGIGAAAAAQRFLLPKDCKPYIRANAAVLTGAGSNIAQSFYLKLYI